ncbi:hypothetical protein DFH07DRAFT_828311 [Mycena maculata]|uniref:Uncharacterized protein n=1 Tax=Mycena maculata TaxID=230809 RepID=A0AAD7N7K2_9AGAR|nr:hypothetical protein DFH07DRAFT_828311 [Mycena maculata]
MQVASYGARDLARKAPHKTRSIHIPSAIRPQSTGLGQRVFAQTRLALSRFVTHLTTRSFHAANPSIQQRLSFTARTALARPLHPHFVPRGPVLPRTVAQVGLGTARNFSSARPLFQQLADNVPIAARAFYEADWETAIHTERENMSRPAKKPPQIRPSKELLKPTPKPAVVAVAAPEMDMEHYFAAPSAPAVTTYLLIPLAPTPTARAPLPEFPAERLPLPALLALHDAHATHALRVSSLFQRLDSADVWARGVACSAYSSSAAPRGVCTVLKVEFRGWSKAAVRGVIGESGTGWCVLEEAAPDSREDDEDAFSDTSSVLSGMEDAIDPAQSFVLPTLDFSSAFRAASASPHHSPALFAHPNSSGSDLGAWSDAFSDDVAFVDPPSENGWFERSLSASEENPWLETQSGWGLGFSSAFAQRQARAEPLESAFA